MPRTEPNPIIIEKIDEYTIEQTVGTGEIVSTGTIDLIPAILGSEIKTLRSFCSVTGTVFSLRIDDHEGLPIYFYQNANTMLIDNNLEIPCSATGLTHYVIITLATGTTTAISFKTKVGVRSITYL